MSQEASFIDLICTCCKKPYKNSHHKNKTSTYYACVDFCNSRTPSKRAVTGGYDTINKFYIKNPHFGTDYAM